MAFIVRPPVLCILFLSSIFLSCTKAATDPVVHVVQTVGGVKQVRVEFNRSFSSAEVDHVARDLLKADGRRSAMLIAFFDRRRDGMGLAYPEFRGGGAHNPSAILYEEMIKPWPITTFAQMIVRGENATVWYRNGQFIEQWNILGTNDASKLGGQHWIRSAKVVEDAKDVMVWIEAHGPPNEATCSKVGKVMAAELFLPSLLLVIRNDSWFGWTDGPMYFPFVRRTEPPPSMAEMSNAPRCVAYIKEGRNKLR